MRLNDVCAAVGVCNNIMFVHNEPKQCATREERIKACETNKLNTLQKMKW